MTPATILEHDGVKQSITEWALDYGITPGIIIARLERGETVANAIRSPMKVGHRAQRLPIFSPKQAEARRRKPRAYRPPVHARSYTFEGKTLTTFEWSRLTGIKQTTIAARIRLGWSIDRVLTTSLDHRGRRPGVPSDFAPSQGTGGRSPSQETPNITFSGIDA